MLSWYGESVGHYEGDTLVIDTIGLNTKTFVDAYRTPHTEKLHIVERWRMANDRQMEVTFTVDDPDTYYQPWSGMRRYRRVDQQFAEDICAENNQLVFDYNIPAANKPDF
jgi:alpha-L-fucosidase